MRKAAITICFAMTVCVYADRVLHYCMNDNAASANVVDSEGRYDGTYKDANGAINTSTGSTTGKVNNCLDFDGDEYIDIGDPLQSVFRNDFSIALWFKADDGQPATLQYLVGTVEGDVDESVWMTLLNTGAFLFTYRSNGNAARLLLNAGNPLLSDGQEDWHHLVMIVDSSVRDIGGILGYFDGSLQTVGPVYKGDTTNVVSSDYTSIINLGIGATLKDCEPFNTGHFTGLIDDVRIYSEALTATNVSFLYNSGDGLETDFLYYFLADAE